MGRNDAAAKAAPPAQPDALPVFKFVEDPDQHENTEDTVFGDNVYGVVQKVALGIGKKQDVDLVEVVDEDHGEVVVFLGSMGLQQGLVEGGNNLGRPVQKGDVVYIRFDGKIDLDSGRTFNQFALHLEAGDPRAAAAKAAAPSGANVADDPVDAEDIPF